LDVLELVPAPAAESPTWLGSRFLVTRRADWKSSAEFRDMVCSGLDVPKAKVTGTPAEPQKIDVLVNLAEDDSLRQLLTDPASTAQPVANDAVVQVPGVPAQPTANLSPEQMQIFNAGLNNNESNATKVNPDTQARIKRAEAERGQGSYQNQATSPGNTSRSGYRLPPPGPKPVVAFLGPLMPLWVSGGSEDRSVVSRLVQIGDKRAYEVALLDLPMLQSVLADEVRDLLPEMQVHPVSRQVAPNPERAMTALPLELEPGPPSPRLTEELWNALRIGLLLAWAAALVALSAVALGGWSLLNLSERRIRFVSAVTHELRTPLTTLRLYLDMLAHGMVQDEKQKSDYIQTLNTEADRLNRLVGNVLDFSRLENQRPRLEKTSISLGDLLGQVESTWQARCRNAEKELVIENHLTPDTMLFTDVQLLNQILGNLIDNACKYSRGAEDRRIWLRASTAGRGRLFLDIEDRGTGVPAGESRSIFRPFRRGNGEHATVGGVGLGLALARRWANLLNGKITLTGGTGKNGACFRVDIPCI
jgi:signal transduction histidine kinase